MNCKLRTGRPRSDLCGRVIRREVIEIVGLVIEKYKSFETANVNNYVNSIYELQ